MKDEECDKLSKVRDQMEEEIEELTASLFEVTYLFVWFNLLLLIIFLFLQTFCRTIIIQGLGLWCLMLTFNNISAISWLSVFIGGGNLSTLRKPPYYIYI